MGRRRGLLAEIQHQHRLAQRRQAQQQREAVRTYNTAVREAQRTAQEQLRYSQALQRATQSQRAAAERQAKAAQVAAQEAEANRLNAELAATYEEIDGLLRATLDVDDWVDLRSLRRTPDEIQFDSSEFLVPAPAPTYHGLPNPPMRSAPMAPTGLSGAFGGQRRHAAAVEEADRNHQAALAYWQQAFLNALNQNAVIRAHWHDGEFARRNRLADAQARHEQLVADNQREVVETNAALDRLTDGLRTRRPDAMDEYVSIVLANSVYPDAFPVSHEHAFIGEDRELRVTALAPAPDDFPTVKAYRYNRTNDEITSTKLPAAEIKRRYASAVQQLALRTAHEIFEADREAVIDSVSLTVAVDAIDVATGHPTRIDMVRLATDRRDFLSLNLQHVDASAALSHLSAAMSKNPYGLSPLAAQGVRG